MISIRDCFSSFLLYFSDANNEDFHRRIAQLQSEVSALSNARANLAFERDTLQTEKQMLISAHDAKVKEVDGELSAMLVHLTEVTEEAAANEERVHNLTAKTYALEQIASTKDREIASLRASLDAANAQSSDNVQQLRGEMVQKEQEVLQLLDSVARARRGKPFATTRLDAPANAGSSELVCNVPARCLSGMLVVIGDGNDNEEERHIVGFASILVDHPLSHAHPVGTIVTIYDPNQLVHTSNLAAVTTELQEQRQQLAQVEIQLREQAAEYQRYQDEADRATLATLAQHSAQVEDFQCLLARSYEERDKITAGNVEYQRQLATTQIANVEASVVAEERDKLRRELERTKTSLADVTSEFQTYQEQMMRSVGEAKMTQIRESAVSEQLRNEVEDLQRQVAIHVSEVDRVTAEREALQKEKDAMGRDTDAELQKLRVRLAEMTMSLAALQSEKQMLASLHDAKVKEVDGELSAMLVHLTEVTEEAAANEERVHNLTAKTYALEQIASNKDREIASLRTSLDDMHQLRGEMAQKVQHLQDSVTNLTATADLRKSSDEPSVDDEAIRIATMEASVRRIDDLSASLAALQQQLSTKEAELVTQQHMVMTVAEEYQSYKLRVGDDLQSRDFDVKVLKGEISQLTTEAASAQADHHLLQMQYDELLERFERMERLYTEALAENTILSR